MDQFLNSSGHTSETTTREQSMLSPETKRRNEMTLMKLRRLTRIVMCKTERHRFETRTLQRSNIIKYLEDHIMHTSEHIRSLSLEMLCCAIPRLGNKTDGLLKPVLPKVFQCFKKNESKELKTKALHFLRGYYHHTRKLSGFIDNFIKLGIQNPDPEIQICCCLGLNIIFDQDLGNCLFSQLITPIVNILKQKENFDLIRAAYRALKFIHGIVKDARFCDFIKMAHPDAEEMYKNMYNFEDIDSFLTMEDNDCSAVILEYQIKRHNLSLDKDFGILDSTLLLQIQKTRSCERARAVYNFYTALKQASWSAEDLDMHILDLLRIIKCFVSDSNRLVQLYGFGILKEIINKVGFRLAPYIQWVLEIICKGLTSSNTKMKTRVHRVLYKLMLCMHPMTVVWNLLNTDDASVREAIIRLVQKVISHFSYHEIDMIALCNYLGRFLEDSNIKLAKSSKDCIILLLNTMRDCPAYGIKTEAIKTLLKDHNFCWQTLKGIGVIGNMEDVYQEDFESYSEEEISDQDASSTHDSSTVMATALSTRTLSTANESNARCWGICSGFVNSNNNLHKDASCSYLNRRELNIVEPSVITTGMSHRSITSVKNDARSDNICRTSSLFQPNKIFYEYGSSSHVNEEYKSIKKESSDEENTAVNFKSDKQRRNKTTDSWGSNFTDSLNKMEENTSAESSVTSILKERLLSDSTASQFSACAQHELGVSRQPWSDSNVDDNLKYPHETKGIENSNLEKILAPKNADSNDIQKNCFSRFHLDPVTSDSASDSEKQARRIADTNQKNKIPNSAQECDTELTTEVELTSDAQSGIQVDVMNNSVYNYNILIIEHEENDKDSNYTDDFDPLHDSNEIDKVNTLKQSKEAILEPCEDFPLPKLRNIQKSRIPKFKFPVLNSLTNSSEMSEYSRNFPHHDTSSQKLIESNVYAVESSITIESNTEEETYAESVKDSVVGCRLFQEVTKEKTLHKETQEMPSDTPNKVAVNTQENDFVEEINDTCTSLTEDNGFLSVDTFRGTNELVSVSHSKDFDETPFMLKNTQLPRTPVAIKPEFQPNVQLTVPKNYKKNSVSNKRKTAVKQKKTIELKKVEASRDTPREEREKAVKERTDEKSFTSNSSFVRSCGKGKYNSPQSWEGCQWRRDLEYAAKAQPCTWVDKFEETVKSMKPFSSPEAAEIEMKKAIEVLDGSAWMEKEEAMLVLIQLAQHHPEVVRENTTNIAFFLCHEVKNVRQSVAGKAILTIGHFYKIMGKYFENKLRLVIATLLAKSGNRTLAAYFRLVIKTLYIIMDSSPQKSAMAFVYEGCKHTNKAAKETAAQFLTILTEKLGPENSLTPELSSHILKCTASFVFDSSALTRYCGKRMLKVLMNHPDFEKIKDHNLDIDTSHNLSKVIKLIASKGVGDDVLPIRLIV